MEELQPTYRLKGKLTQADSEFANIPVLKAVPHETMVKFGTLKGTFATTLLTVIGKAGDATAEATMVSGEAEGQAMRTSAFHAWRAAGGVLDPTTHIESYSIQGRGEAGAYWMYDGGAAAALKPEKTGHDIIKLCAIEESPEYNTGFTIFRLPSTDAALAARIRRPTTWDGLQFDQFAIVEDSGQCFGVTSGGMGEVVVAPTAMSACTVARNVAL